MGTAPGRVGGRAGRGVSARKRGSPGPCSSWVASDWVTLNGLGRTGCSGLEWPGGRAVPRPVAGHRWGSGRLLVGGASHGGHFRSPLPARLQVRDLISSPQRFAGNILQMQSETQRGLRTCPEHGRI